ncbi:MAG: glycosyltransferase family 39 protein [bacterium]|nr:glycosyltransferase family 39 protein [bacterium]
MGLSDLLNPRAGAFAPALPFTPEIRARWLARLTALVPLIAILALQTAAMSTLRNDIERDEAIYLLEGLKLADLGSAAVPTDASTYFSGLPYFYPFFGGLLHNIGGLEAVRALSTVSMLLATVTVYALARHFFDGTARRDSAYLAAALFAMQPSVIFLGRYATFDALCVLLLGCAAVFAVRAGMTGRVSSAVLTGLFFTLAVATKYAALIYAAPIAVLIGWLTLRRSGFGRAAAFGALMLAIACIFSGIMLLLDPGLTQGLSFTTTAREAMTIVPREQIAGLVIALSGGTILLGFVGFGIYLFAGDIRVPPGDDSTLVQRGIVFIARHSALAPVILTLAAAAVLSPAYHIYKMEFTSLHKHVAFGILFAAPVAGYALMRIGGGQALAAGRRWLLVLIACLLIFAGSLPQAQGLYSWGFRAEAADALRSLVRPASTRILTDEAFIFGYALYDLIDPSQITSQYYFEYTDRWGDTHLGAPAYTRAVDEGYFDVIALGFDFGVTYAPDLLEHIHTSGYYQQVYAFPAWGWERETLIIWRFVGDR